MPAVSSNAGTTGALTGYNQNVELLQATSADIDLTNGIETDTGTGRLVVVANCIAATALNIANGEAAKHVAIDKGADFFGDYTVSGVLNIASFSNTTGTEKRFNILCVTDAAADAAAANDLQGIAIQNNTASVYSPYMHQAVAGVDTFSTTGGNLNFNQPYGFTMARSGSTRTMKIWNDLVLDANQQGTSQVGTTVTWTGQATTTYRYIMPVASHLNGATSKSATFTFGGLRLSGGVTTVAVGQASETDTAQAIAVSQGVLTVAVSQVAETDTAQAIIASQGITAVLGQVTESDLAQSIAMYAATTIAVGQATEVDVAQIILLAFAPQTVSVGQVAETDVAQVISSPTPITIALAQVSEIDLALAITRYDLLTVALGQASEIDLARSITVVFGLSETWSINLKHPTTGLALTGLGNTVVKFEAYQESTVDWFNSATGALQAAQPTPLALLEDVSGNHNGRYAAAATIGVFNTWMVLHIYWDYDAGDGRGVVRRHKWGRVYYNSGVELLPGMTVAQNTMLVTTIPAAIAALPTAAENATAILSAAQTTPIHADVKKVNAVTIQGAGVSGNSMRPV